MNKKAIKNFAIQARKKLIEGVEKNAFQIGIREDQIEIKTNRNIESLVKIIKEKGYRRVIEETAYSWFYWLIILIYMDVNNYLPKTIKGFYSVYKNGNDETLKSKLVKACDILNEMLPSLFQPIPDFAKILFPADLFEDDDSISLDSIAQEDWREVEIIGWLYQYFMEERHKEVVKMNKSRIKKEDVAAATQLFTPKWIVKYMVDNTLGKYWIEATGDKKLEEKLAFYIKENKEERVKNQIDPKSIKVLDPACGAGHILVYAFDVLYDMYIHAGYENDIPKYILKYNLYGLDIDEKASYLAFFALVMKAREKDIGFFHKFKKEKITLNICCIEESNKIIDYKEELLKGTRENIEYEKEQIESLIEAFYDGKEYGSIIQMKNFDERFWTEKCSCLKKDEDREILDKLIKHAKMIDQKYEVVIANPPYLSNKMMSKKLKKYVDQYFKDYNGDLFSVFMKRNLDYTIENGYIAFMTPFVWMFIKRYEKLRKYIVLNKSIVSLVQLEYSSFEGAVVPVCTFVLRNNQRRDEGDYIKLSDFKGAQNQALKTLEAITNENISYRYKRSIKDFKKIPAMPIAYWIGDETRKAFQKGVPLKTIADARVGLQTSDNKRFVRLWHEVDFNRIGFGFKDRDCAKNSEYKWFPYHKGGDFRKWYGNHTHVVNWEEDGKEIRAYNAKLNASRESNIGIANTSYYFKDGITWSFVSSANFGVRISSEGFLFDTAGSAAFPQEDQLYFLTALLCSKIAYLYLMIINPTLNFQPGNIGMLPIIFPDKEIKEKIDILAKECIEISKKDWDAYENSWNFKKHPFLVHKKDTHKIEEAFNNWKSFKEIQFKKLKENEEKLNHIFIRIYGLEKELNSKVREQDITIRKANRKRDIRSFISYAVGCMMGRYALDEDGIVFAGGEFDKAKYKSFQPAEDGILYISPANALEEDIVLRFIEFVKIIFGEDTLDENLEFIADSLDRRENEESISRIRRYFQYDFLKDHLKIYQRRPIYWLFTSGKYKVFQVFVYMHRIGENTITKMRKKALQHIDKKFEKKQRQEILNYDEEFNKLQNMQVKINLDEGVSKNYQNFANVVRLK